MKTAQDLVTQKTIVERVIKKLVHQDNVLLELSLRGRRGEAEEGEEEPVEEEQDPLLVVHSNYFLDTE